MEWLLHLEAFLRNTNEVAVLLYCVFGKGFWRKDVRLFLV